MWDRARREYVFTAADVPANVSVAQHRRSQRSVGECEKQNDEYEVRYGGKQER